MISDIRHALRRLAQTPGFAAIAVLTLALGIGLNTSMFSMLNVLLLRPLPYPGGDRLVRIFVTSPESDRWGMTAPVARDLRGAETDFADLAVFGWWGANLTEPDRPAELLVSIRATPEFLATLGLQPQLGRWFTAADDHPGNGVILISHALWQRAFQGDPQIVGRTIHVDREPVTVIGVMPAAISAPMVFGVIDFWRPLALTGEEQNDTANRWLHAVARLRDDQDRVRANASLHTIAARLSRDHPHTSAGQGLHAVPLHASAADGASRTITWLTLALSGSVLLIACANLANLQLARAMSRTRETVLRAALGASRLRLLRPLAAESVIVALAGGAGGLLVAGTCNRWIGSRVVFNNAPPGQDLPLDCRVLAFALAVSLVTGLIFGCVPGWLAGRVQLATALRDASRGSTTGRSHQRLRRLLVIGEFALALVLLTGATLIAGGVQRFLRRDTGWDTSQVVYGYIATQTPTYRDPAEALRFYEQLLERAATLPGVEGAAFGWDIPITPDHDPRPFRVEGHASASDAQPPVAYVTGTLPGYFDALGIRQLAGRDFSRRDTAASPRVAIVNESLARTFWPGQSAVGRRLIGTDPTAPGWIEIVGVVGDVRFAGHLNAPSTRFQIYIPFAQEVWNWGAIALRTHAAPEALIEPLRRLVSGLDADVPLFEARTVSDEVARQLANTRLIGQLLGGVALLGLFLAALGIYGLTAHTVNQRTPEIGIRMALGADVTRVYRLVFGSGIRLTLVGIGLGALGALGLGRTLAALAPEIPAENFGWLALTALVLILAALVATWLPARRAVRIDPIIALRDG